MTEQEPLPKTQQVRKRMLNAAKESLLDNGFAKLSTRNVAEKAGVPLSQIHYHFKSKRGLILALLQHENDALLERQRVMYQADLSLSERWLQACEFLEVDINTGYVRTLQEMIAAAWTDQDLAIKVREMMTSWVKLLTEVVEEAYAKLGSLGPLTAKELAGLIGALFLGIESILLLDPSETIAPAMSGLKNIGQLIKSLESAGGAA